MAVVAGSGGGSVALAVDASNTRAGSKQVAIEADRVRMTRQTNRERGTPNMESARAGAKSRFLLRSPRRGTMHAP